MIRTLSFFALTIAIVMGLVGCAGSRLGTGGSGFCRAESAHFVLYSDLGCARARAQLVDFESWLAALSTLGWGGFGGASSAPLRLNVIMLSRKSELARYARHGARAYFVESILMEPWVVMPASPIYQADTLKHELVHYIAFQSIPQQPAWFAEGVATYFATASFVDEGWFAVGRPDGDFYDSLAHWGVLDAKDIMHPTASLRASFPFYLSSWLLVHYLMCERASEFEVYQKKLAQGVHFDEAWAEAFPDLTAPVLNATLNHYAHRSFFDRFRHPIQEVRHVAVKVSSLSLADEHALQGILWLSGCRGCSMQERQNRANRAFEAALRANSAQLQASVRKLAYFGKSVSTSAFSEARALALRHPEEWTAWATYAFVANADGRLDDRLRDPDPIVALDRLVPRHPYTWILKAHREANSDLTARALRSAKYAIRLSPQSAMILSHAIKVFAKVKACGELSEAVSTLRRLEHVDLSSEDEAELKDILDKCPASGDPADAPTASRSAEHSP